MRYAEKRSVAEVLGWLQSNEMSIPRDTFQKFLRRVLNLLPDDKAEQVGVSLDFLRAIRRRLKLPLAPPLAQAPQVKALARFPSRSRRRRVPTEKQVKPAPMARPPHREHLEPTPLPFAGHAGSPPTAKAPPAPQLLGTPEQPANWRDWKILNEIARKKIFAVDRMMHPNHQGTVLHLTTGQEYTPEELVAQFGLTLTEARSCFISFEETKDPNRW